ncbi:hypothetical protein KEJ15_02160 [Candidatus Bathyarchaeota archaeon]|nr:hypothetical protein [Candidatus Bathyarchaeota archaeon]
MTRKGAYAIPLETHADGPNRRDKPKSLIILMKAGLPKHATQRARAKTPTPERTQLRGATLRSEVER